MKKKKLYTQGDVNRVFKHIPPSTLLFWATSDLVQWVDETRDGRGRHRLYDIYGLYQIGFIEELSGLNFKIETIKNWVVPFHFFWDTPTPYAWIVGKNNPITQPEEYQEAYRAPGWPMCVMVPRENWQDNEMVKKNFPDAYILIAIDLSGVVEKVHRYIERAKE